jgi:hypothetical protein
LHPPLAEVNRSHESNDELMANCDWQAGSILSGAQFNVTAGDAVIVKVALSDPEVH